MGSYQRYKGNPETKLFYLIDQLVGGINTDFSDDVSPDNEFKSIVNFNMDKRGSLNKRLGFGKLNAVSEILQLLSNTELPDTKVKTPENPKPETTNDNIVYMKMLQNDNNCFRNLSAFTGDKAYRKYQELYGAQINTFKILIITLNDYSNESYAWVLSCTLPPLQYNDSGVPTSVETIEVSSVKTLLPIMFTWDKNLTNIDTIEFFDKIYLTHNSKGLVVYDRTNNTFSYNGSGITGITNSAYKPNAMEIRKVGFNVLGDDPLHWVDFQGLTTNSIQGIYLTTMDNIPIQIIPAGGKFRLNVLYTGTSGTFDMEFKEGETALTFDYTSNTELSTTGLAVYDVTLKTVPTSEVEIKISMSGVTIDPYYDYYQVGSVDKEEKPIVALNVGTHGIIEMYNRAIYYKGDTIWFSEINKFNYVPNYNYVTLPIEPTDEITKIVYFKNVYIIFTKNRIYKMIGSFGASDFQLMPVNLSIGCHAPKTVVPVENELYFASTRGLYALKSSEFRDGIENLKELDTKIKNITSDVTKYLGETDKPAIRYNGISKYAHAIRYKDKYMLFNNTSYDDGDLSELNNNDVLVYQYELRAFSEMRFAIKPTFLFMVDNSIEVYCKLPEKEEFTTEETLFDFNFENAVKSGNKILDNSNNHMDASMAGDLVINPGIGLTLSGNNYLKTEIISSKFGLSTGNSIKVGMKSNLIQSDSFELFRFAQSLQSGGPSSSTQTIVTNWSSGYRYEMVFKNTPNVSTRQDTISYTLNVYRDSTSRKPQGSALIELYNVGEVNPLIFQKSYDFTFSGSNLSYTLGTGSFLVNRDEFYNYTKKWMLSVDANYKYQQTVYDKGPNTSFDFTQVTQKAGYSIRLYGYIEAIDGGAKLHIVPEFKVKQGWPIYTTNRILRTNVSVNTFDDIISADTDASSAQTYPGTEHTQNYSYNADTYETLVKGAYNAKATVQGTYIDWLEISGQNVAFPKSKITTQTVTTSYTCSYTGNVTLPTSGLRNYREIKMYYENSTLKLYCSNENGEETITINMLNQNNIFSNKELIFSIENTTSGGNVYVYNGSELIGSGVFTKGNIISACDRDNCTILTNCKGDISELYLKSNNSTILLYDFHEGLGTKLNDISGNNLSATINGVVTWIVEKGIYLNGFNSYLVLPQISSEIMFSNGFTIEFSMRTTSEEMLKGFKLLDLATTTDSGSTSTGKCSINIGSQPNSDNISFMSTSYDYKTYRISKNIDYNSKHNYKITCIDNGKGYTLSLYQDDTVIAISEQNYGGITNILRRSNLIGKSNNNDDSLFKGMIYSLKLKINASASPIKIYNQNMYEFDTTPSDFDRDMYFEIETKGINLQYPLHTKKLKNIFIKGVGGYNLLDTYFEIYQDGHLVNDPKTYNCYIDDVTKQVVYDYTVERALTFNEKVSLLGNLRLNKTKLGNTTYETRKLVFPSKGKNFTIKIYGESSDFLSIESIGFLFKLGKVREE